MSDTNPIVNTGSDRATVTEETIVEMSAKTKKEQDAQAEYVRKQAYEEVSKDMHKFKSKAKDAEARIAEFEAKLKAIEEQKLKDEKRYQELYEREKQERERADSNRKKDRELYLRGLKMSALKSELGNIKDAYLTHAAIDEIEINEDGTLSSDSVRSVANKFRQEHSQLIPSDVSGNITSFASPTSFSPTSGKVKSLNEMSYEEKARYLKQLKNK
jgi:predicted  nucleic acid-binding Zn-ribbon protein